MKKSAALLLLLGLVCAPAAYAKAGSPAATPAPLENAVPHRSGEDFITLNFTNIDIAALVKVMSELTRKNFILDERVTGKVTLMTPTRISSDEAYQVFLSALEIKGFTAVEDGRIIRIIPTASARQSGLKVYQDGEAGGEGFVTKLVRMNFVNPQEIVRTITPLVTKDGSIIAYSATNSVIITDSVSNLRKLESLIHAMDVAAPEGKGKINVYYLKNANAEDMAKILQALVARLPVPGTAAAQSSNPSAILEGAVTISSDKATNSLIVVGSPGDYDVVKDVIQKLDIRRRQVYVEAAIIEMGLSKMRDIGFEFLTVPQEIQTGAGAPITPLGGTNFGNIGNVVASGPAALSQMNGLAIGAIKGSFTYNNQTFLNVGALLHALQTDGNVNVLSTPNILTMDNQKAEIMVGQNVPFPTGQTQNAVTGSSSLFNTIERKDVGIKLSLTPQITSDDNVRLDVNQEISDVVASSGASATGYITNKRQASTTVVVKDRQTMVIGGLIRDNVTSSTSKVPFLGDIPVIGWLFRSKQSKLEKTNLMIFITPYIIKNENDANDLTNQKNAQTEEFRKEYNIQKKTGSSGITSRTAPAAEPPTVTRTVPPQEPKAEAAPPAPTPPAAPPAVPGALELRSDSTPTQQPAAIEAPKETGR